MLANMKKNQVAQKQQVYVGFTPLDPKHRIVLERCEEDIEAMEARLTVQTADSKEHHTEPYVEDPSNNFSDLEDEMNRLEQQLEATS